VPRRARGSSLAVKERQGRQDFPRKIVLGSYY
jgi:hypothetical protein